MDCPHCGTENLVGARICASCGGNVMSMPQRQPAAQTAAPAPQAAAQAAEATGPPRAATKSATVRSTVEEMSRPVSSWGGAATAAPPERAPQGPVEALCRICQSPFERSADDARDAVCPSCRSLSAQVQHMAPNEVQILPATMEEAPKRGFADRLGSSELRPRPVLRKRASLRAGPVAAIVGLALGLAGLGVVAWQHRDTDRSKAIAGETRSEPVRIGTANAQFSTVQRATVRFTMAREQAQSFGGLSKVLDIRQKIEQISACAVALVREDGAVFDVESEGRVVEQTGKAPGTDGREANLYPWGGIHPRIRVGAAPSKPLAQLDGEAVSVGREVPPLFHVGELRPASASFQPGDRWKADVRLPLVVSRAGQTVTCDFPLDVIYAGVAVKSGIRCAVFRVVAKTLTKVPLPLSNEYNRCSGTIGGAVWIELDTGVTAAADVESDLRIWHDTGRVEDELRVQGQLTIDRK